MVNSAVQTRATKMLCTLCKKSHFWTIVMNTAKSGYATGEVSSDTAGPVSHKVGRARSEEGGGRKVR